MVFAEQAFRFGGVNQSRIVQLSGKYAYKDIFSCCSSIFWIVFELFSELSVRVASRPSFGPCSRHLGRSAVRRPDNCIEAGRVFSERKSPNVCFP